ncbi:hypothetical protein THRCLA_11957 [Thraustotheca clavata]|uniref:Transmembrane protein n=1 Tax=Thraustotheca clavata TaxID=74557 RepID=A0A1V9Y4L0_9STRA|nr:hypothetical protein THRCLA_11957 [Thraustotheca clavata]
MIQQETKLTRQTSCTKRRRRTISRQWTKSQREAFGRLRINMAKPRPLFKENRPLGEFKTNLGLGVRTACAVLVSSAFVTLGNSNSGQMWACFPNWYILGGISFIGVSAVCAMGRNIGATMQQMFQQKVGIFMSFIFNAILFWNFQPQLFPTSAHGILN